MFNFNYGNTNTTILRDGVCLLCLACSSTCNITKDSCLSATESVYASLPLWQEFCESASKQVIVPTVIVGKSACNFSSTLSDESIERVLHESPIKVSKDKLAFNLSRLNDIAELREDWNGYGAAPIPDCVISEAIRIISDLNEQPDAIFPTGRKSIQFEYHLSDKSYLEFEIFDEKVVVIQVFGTDYDNARFWELPFEDRGYLRKIVDDFVNAQ